MANTECKYSTYKELAEAFRCGELDREKFVLVMDNDCCSLEYRGNDLSETDAYEMCKKIFRGGGYRDIVEVCEVAGIPTEWC